MNTNRKSEICRVLALTAGLLAVSPFAATGAAAHNSRTIAISDARICEGNSGTRSLRSTRALTS